VTLGARRVREPVRRVHDAFAADVVLVEIHEPQRAVDDLRMRMGVADPTKMVFVEDARNASRPRMPAAMFSSG
jgi:hypothetical protein